VICSFRDKEAEAIFQRRHSRRYANIERIAYRKLLMLDAAGALRDLLHPPGNRIEALRGDRTGQHSIRINDQWRICFEWRDGHAYEVEIADYH
jgi:proteic killer suppression protein